MRRPVLKPALRRLWRDASTLQIGVDPCRAVVLAGTGDHDGTAVAKVLDALDGTRDRPGVVAAARAAGVREATVSRVLDLLSGHGLLDDAAADTTALQALALEERDRFEPDLASISLVRGDPGAGVPVLARRRAASVRVHGAGRVGAALASLLAASGVGRIDVVDTGVARHADTAPGGLSPDDVGSRRDHAAMAALRRVAPQARTDPGPATQADRPDRPAPVDLVVLAPVGPLPPGLADALLREGVPHLFAGVRETTGVVGPLVVPGTAACMRCQDLHRTDRDPAWPRLAAQLATPTPGVEACDTVLAAAVAAHAVMEALAFLDRSQPPPATLGGTLELALPDWRWRRRSWMPHPACGCQWNQPT